MVAKLKLKYFKFSTLQYLQQHGTDHYDTDNYGTNHHDTDHYDTDHHDTDQHGTVHDGTTAKIGRTSSKYTWVRTNRWLDSWQKESTNLQKNGCKAET